MMTTKQLNELKEKIHKLSDDDLERFRTVLFVELRNRGWALIAWTPAELGGVDPDRVQDREIELGWQIIEDLK